MSRPLRGTVCELTLSREAGGWYATVTTQRWIFDRPKPVDVNRARMRGFDWGVVNTIAGSDGSRETLPLDKIKRLEARAEHYQRLVSRRKKGSKRRDKARAHLAGVQQRIRRMRLDWKTTTRSVDELEMVALEGT